MKKPKIGYVYILKSINFYKIGSSFSNVKSRIKTHKSSNPHIEVYGIYHVGDSHNLEKFLHSLFDDKRKKGTEWFLLSEDEVLKLKNILSKRQDEFI